MEDLCIGKLLDNRYEILEQVGSGGMAEVYKAKCHRLNRLVAVKVLKPELAKDAEFRRRFHDESQAVAMLSHPNIVAVYDVSKSSDLEYIVMELIDGITLKQYMCRKGEPLNWREALHFITQIVKALGHAHSRGIIHRDIKPQNIMVLRDGSVKVADFGIARLATAQQATLTQEALGSVHYISPEQARGSHIDCRSDLYSAGVVLYEMLTGRLPFEGDSPVSVAIQHINSIPLEPRDLNPDIPEALEAITMKAMSPNRSRRYVNADEMLADLEEFRKNPSINFDYTVDPSQDEPENEPTRPIPVESVKYHTGNTKRPAREEPSAAEEDEEEYDTAARRKKSSNAGPILMGIGALLMFFIGIGYFLWTTFFSGLFQPVEMITIPDLRGKTMAEIQIDREISDVFTVEQVGEVFDETIPAGQVVSQSPEAGEKRKAGELTITVEISAGQESTPMTSLVGKEYREAYLEITNLGLKAGPTQYATSDEVVKGYVISHTPEEGTRVLPGDTVILVVSTGPEEEMVLMPDLVNETIETARAKLAELGLSVGDEKYVEDMALPGIVLEQSVETGTEVPAGSFVNLVLSKGPDEAEPTPVIPSQMPTASPSQSPEVTPTTPVTTPPVESEPVVTQPPVTTPTPAPTPNYKRVSVDLGGGEGTVQVTILVGGKTAYDNVAGRNLGSVSITVPGIGEQEVQVYLDGVLISTQTVDFNA